MEKDITINPSRPTRRSLIPTSSTLVTEPYVPVRDRKPPLPSRPPPSPSSLIPMPNNKTGSKSEVTMSFRSRNTVKFTANAFSALNNKVYCNKNDSNVSHQDQQGNVDKEEGESNVMTSTSISVAELATRFLEENVRKCIKPRIFPVRFPPCRVLYCMLSCTIIFHDIFVNFLREFCALHIIQLLQEVWLSYYYTSFPSPSFSVSFTLFFVGIL